MSFTLVGSDGRPFASPVPGTLGGHRRGRIYGRLDCPAAARAIARGGYVGERVFFADEPAAIAAGYRPCAVCMPDAYARWKRGAPARPALDAERWRRAGRMRSALAATVGRRRRARPLIRVACLRPADV